MGKILECREICKDYGQGRLVTPVLRNINFSMESGEYVAVMGPSGSGKSTLMNLIGCLDRPTSGEILLDGALLKDCTDDQLADIRLHKIGFVFQNFQLLGDQTALQNVELPLIYAKVAGNERKSRAGRPDAAQTEPAFRRAEAAGGDCQGDGQSSGASSCG